MNIRAQDMDARGYRNRVRGILSSARERGFGIDDGVRERRLRIALRSILLQARFAISPDKYQEHLQWVLTQTRGTAIASSEDVGRGLLFSNVYTERAELALDLNWIGARLRTASKTINEHLKFRRLLTEAFLKSDQDLVLSILDKAEASLGDSHWLIAIRISALQRFEGIDAQKAYLAKLRGRASKGISAAFAYFVSIRNEPSVTPAWFRNDILRRPFSSKHPEVRPYMRFALLGEVPHSSEEICDVLRVEQANSDVDLYETTIAVAQALSVRPLGESTTSAIRHLLSWINNEIHDPRLTKISALCMPHFNGAASLPVAEDTLLIKLMSGRSITSEDQSEDQAIDDPASMVWCALAHAVAGSNNSETNPDRIIDEIVSQLQRLCERGVGFEETRASLLKLATNLSGLIFGRFLTHICTSLSEPAFLELPDRLSAASLNTGAWGMLDRVLHRQLGAASPVTLACCAFQLADCLSDANCSDEWGPTAKGFASLRAAVRAGDFETAYEFVERLVVQPNSIAVSWGQVAAVEVYAANKDVQNSLRLIGNWAVSAHETQARLPIALALDGIRSAQITKYGDQITTPIALNAWRLSGDNDDKQTLLRMAFNRFMRSTGARTPSTLPIELLRTDPTAYSYFLEHVCVPVLMDMNPAFSSSQALQVERRSICALLRTLNPSRSSAYDEEIVSITQMLSIWEGLKIVDGSRIHVDEDAFSRAVQAELSGSFARYASLLKAGIGVAENFDTVLRSLVRQEGYAESLSIPENEADELLTTMVLRMKQMFLSNGIYGLDGYVSKRIRHGSLIGHLRGPVERRKLITQRPTAQGAYEINHHWIQRLNQTEGDARIRLSKALEDFSKTFDRELLSLKNEKLQIRDEKHADGIFDFPLTAAALLVIRSSIKTDVSLEGLVRAALVAFWTLLRPALSEAQDLVRVRFQDRVSEMFHRLTAAASPCIKNEPIYGEFMHAIRLAAEETKIQIATVAGWFEKSGVDDHGRTYSLDDAIDIGVQSAQSAFSDFRPYVVKRCDPILMPNASLQLIADVLLIALGNIYSHSGMGNQPQVDIEAKLAKGEETVTFNIKSKVSPSLQRDEIEANLELLRDRIRRKEFEPYVGSEGNSGLLKLAALALHSEHGDLCFGFTPNDEFELTIKLSFILEIHPAERVAE